MSDGDIWVLAGQSNMEGWGRLHSQPEVDPRIRVLDMARQWRVAQHPLHVLADSPDAAHVPQSGQEREDMIAFLSMFQAAGVVVGPGLSFGRRYVELTGVPVGLVATAHGGTSMAQWSPDLRDQGGDSLYGSMLLSIKAAGSPVTGVLWYQGESDADPATADDYAAQLEKFISAVRRDLEQPELPFVMVQIGRLATDSTSADAAGLTAAWNTVREVQRTATSLGATAVTTAVDLTLDDGIHLDAASQDRLGRRLAGLVTGTLTQPDVDRVEQVDDAGVVWRVSLRGVNGRLQAGVVSGFSIRRPSGEEVTSIYRADITDDGQAVELRLAAPPGAGAELWYGYGLNPLCTVVDEFDMALPAAGPFALRASTLS